MEHVQVGLTGRGVHVDTVNFTTTTAFAENAPDLHYYCEHHPGMGGTVTTQTLSLKDMLIEDAVSAGLDPYPVDEAATTSIPLIEAQPGAGDYAYVDRSFGGAIIYESDGSTQNIDFDGSENTFFLDVSSEFDFFGFSYDPAYTDDSGGRFRGIVGTGTRTIEFGESTGDVGDWDVISFDGLDTAVTIDLSAVDVNYDVTVTNKLNSSLIETTGPVSLNSDNGHYYQAIDQYMSWDDAKVYASL